MSSSKDSGKGKRKFPPKKKTAQKAEPEPETYDECIDEALSLEDKGDRYRDGEKARRFYERACMMYERAATFKADAEVMYNWGRLSLLLAEFSNPPYSITEKAALFTSSISKFRAVVDLEPENADNLFNLAQALRGKAELILDPSEGANSGGEASAVKLLEEAGRVLDVVFTIQKKEFESASSGAVTDNHAGCEGCTTCANEGDQMEVENTQTPPDTQEGEHSDHHHEEEFATVDEIHAVTVDSLIDTLNTHAQVLSMLSREIAEPESAVLFDQAIARLRLAAEYAERGGPECQGGVEVQMRWAEVLSDRADIVAQSMGYVNKALFQEAIERLDGVLRVQPRNAEALCDKGDALCSYAEALRNHMAATGNMQQGSSSSSSSSASDETVTPDMLYAHAIDSYAAACNIEPNNAPVIVKYADTHLLRVPTMADPNVRKQLALTAAQNYQRALKLKDPNVDSVNALLHLAKALSYLDGKEEEIKYVVGQLKRAVVSEGGAVGDDMDVFVGWGEGASAQPWFQQLMGGM
ncbi:hypothetical protein HDV00_003848 [Rhizophlyctis rosea]|nr:hypothetical protein HDV00_003848 [Rhizophlyctis rosea]